MLSADVCHLSLSEMLLQCFPAGLAQAYSWTSLLWSDTVARLQLLSGYLSLCFFVSFSVFSVLLFIVLLSYLSFISASLTLPPIVFLTHYLPLSRLHPFLFLSPCLSSSLRPSTSLSHTLVATLKTVVTMVTAMCCGNVKELNPPRITSLFNT